jgi:transcriptional regulator with XRE-family HTH domain
MSMVGAAIRALREERALTQEALADRAGVSAAALARIEAGQTRPRPSTLHKLADALAIDIRVLTQELVRERTQGSEDDKEPVEDLREVGEGASPLAALQARDALQRVAEDVLAGVVSRTPELPDELRILAEFARRLRGPVADQGIALATFLEAIRSAWQQQGESADPREAYSAAQELVAAVRDSSAYSEPTWEPAYRKASQCYAALLLYGAPRWFHEAVGYFLIRRAELTLDALVSGEPTAGEEAPGRRQVTALATIFSLFDLANGARRTSDPAAREPKGSATEVPTDHLVPA